MLGFLKNLKRRIISKYYRCKVLQILETETYPCILCGNTEVFELVQEGDRFNLPIKTQRCGRCGLVFVQPTPTDEFLSKFYTTGMYRGLYKGYTKATKEFIEVDRSNERAHMWIDFVAAKVGLSGPTTVLDYGCSEATFLKELKKTYPHTKVYGVEPGADFSQFNRENVDGLFESIDAVSGVTFDLVTSWHVLEHLKDPITVLKKIQSKMNAGGHLVVEVPNVDAYGDNKRAYHIGHLFHFNKATITEVLNRSGFTVLNVFEAPVNAIRVIARKI